MREPGGRIFIFYFLLLISILSSEGCIFSTPIFHYVFFTIFQIIIMHLKNKCYLLKKQVDRIAFNTAKYPIYKNRGTLILTTNQEDKEEEIISHL